jgi:hypothetical protein
MLADLGQDARMGTLSEHHGGPHDWRDDEGHELDLADALEHERATTARLRRELECAASRRSTVREQGHASAETAIASRRVSPRCREMHTLPVVLGFVFACAIARRWMRTLLHTRSTVDRNTRLLAQLVETC